MSRPRAFVYVDGFNLYNGLKRRASKKGVPETEYRWLDLAALARHLLPHAEVIRVFYFTSRVKRHIWNPTAADRQEVFLRALEHIPEIELVEGHFQPTRVRGRLVGDPLGAAPVTVKTFKEKRSDVNLAAYLLEHAYEKKCQLAAVVSGDSDLVRPLELAGRRLPFGVVVLNPNVTPCGDFDGIAGVRQILIPEATLRMSQLPLAVLASDGTRVERPTKW